VILWLYLIPCQILVFLGGILVGYGYKTRQLEIRELATKEAKRE